MRILKVMSDGMGGYTRLKKYDDFEIERIVGYWSVFGHLKEGGRECICDVKTKDEAQFIENIFSLALLGLKFWGEE